MTSARSEIVFFKKSGSALAILIFWLTPGLALAHPMLQNAMWIQLTPDRIQVKLEVSVRELIVVQGLPVTVDGTVDPIQAEDTAPRHSDYVADHLHFQADDLILTGKVTKIDPPAHLKQGGEGPDQSHFIYHLDYPLGSPPSRITLTQSMVKEFPSAPGVPWDLSYTYRCGPPSDPMKSYGVLPRDTRISFLPDGNAAPEIAPTSVSSNLPTSQAGLMALWAALGLNISSRRDGVKIAFLAIAAFAAGFLAQTSAGFGLPSFVLAALAGTGIILSAVDNIHRPGAILDWKRLLLAIIFSSAIGLSAGRTALSVNTVSSSVSLPELGAEFVLPAVVTFILVTVILLRLQKGLSVPITRTIRQILSLFCGAAGLVILFDGLGIRPWDYWLSRLWGSSS